MIAIARDSHACVRQLPHRQWSQASTRHFFVQGSLACLISISTAIEPTQAQSLLQMVDQEMSQLVAAARPAVVTVQTVKRKGSGEGSSGLLGIFGDRQGDEKEIKVGTGLVISSDGFVLTKESVLRSAEKVEVVRADGLRQPAEVVACDSSCGIALLKIPALALKPARLQFREEFPSGSLIAVIGNALGVPSAVSLGVIGAVQPDGMMQISANVEPGSNGSPVFNTRVEAIAMVVGRLSFETGDARSGSQFSTTAMAYSFAKLRPFIRKSLLHYYDTRGWIGVTVVNDVAAAGRVYILRLAEDGPGAQAGLLVGDTITHFDGQPVDSPGALAERVMKTTPNQQVEVRIERAGQESTLRLTVAARAPLALRELDLLAPAEARPEVPAPDPPLRGPDTRIESLMLQHRIEALEREVRSLRNLYKKH